MTGKKVVGLIGLAAIFFVFAVSIVQAQNFSKQTGGKGLATWDNPEGWCEHLEVNCTNPKPFPEVPKKIGMYLFNPDAPTQRGSKIRNIKVYLVIEDQEGERFKILFYWGNYGDFATLKYTSIAFLTNKPDYFKRVKGSGNGEMDAPVKLVQFMIYDREKGAGKLEIDNITINDKLVAGFEEDKWGNIGGFKPGYANWAFEQISAGSKAGVSLPTPKPSTGSLANAERLQLLEDKYLKGEIPTDVYLELREKYRGKKAAPEVKSKSVKGVPGNLVKNFSFEEKEQDGIPAGWIRKEKTFGGSSCHMEISLDPQIKHSGNQCLKYSAPVNSGGFPGLAQKIKVIPGKRYSLTLWLKGENLKRKSDGEPVIIYGNYLDQDGNEIKKRTALSQELKQANGSPDWTQIKISPKHPAPENAKYFLLQIVTYSCSGTAWIDDVVVLEQ